MTTPRGLIAIVAGLILSATSIAGPAQDQAGTAQQAAAEAAMTLGPQQAALGELLGTWNVEIVLGDGTKPFQHAKGKAEYSWVVQGRWLGCHVTGQLLGMPYEQFTIFGYDSYARNLVEVSVESVDNSMLMSRGTVSKPDQPVTALFGELDEYASGVLHRPYKVLLKRQSARRHVTMIVGFDDDGNEVKKLEFVFSR